MSKTIFEEMHQLSHNDDQRYRLLMRGVKKRLEEQKQRRCNLIEKIKYYQSYRNQYRNIQVKEWS
ncbi:hypothetical protein [Paenibacillus sp. JNUCC31]|uniref:hypothetical protein n=1 Tax=Paenibacillus sp. JNUCC-31 TaxID=2777983 RepID=UPI001E4E0D53|nr:hypothetical protein [Paenibacillus sp. JNUCC-31]